MITTSIVVSCAKLKGDKNQTEENSILGSYQLKERLVDPGDGSGVYVAVQSEKKIFFLENGLITSNGSLCVSGDVHGDGDKGVFSITDSVILPQSCPGTEIHFVWTQNQIELEYVSVETIKEKFIRE